MGEGIIRYAEPERRGQRVLWSGALRWSTGRSLQVQFEFTCPDAEQFVPHIRPFLLAFLVPAMRLGLSIRLEAPVDPVTVQNLMEWQEAMACWLPNQLRVVPIRGPLESGPVAGNAGQRGALTEFSGGVDSCFTAYRHTAAPDDGMFRRADLRAGLMVHGFDIPEEQATVFDSAFRGSQTLLGAFGLDAFRLRTNLRTLEAALGCDWEYEVHGIWLAAALSCYECFFDHLIIPSSYPFDCLALPWGSNPVTDPLFASASTQVWHDAGALTKLAKVQHTDGHASVREHLRVCWQGAQLDRNCGRCYKCVGTQMCFWVSGVDHPACFPVACTMRDVSRVRMSKPQDRQLFRAILAEARRRDMRHLAGAVQRARIRGGANRLRRLIRRPSLLVEDL